MDDLKTVQALVLADALPTIVFGELAQGTLNAAAAELRRQHALIAQMQRDAVQPVAGGQCVACEGRPTALNNPCALCGLRTAQAVAQHDSTGAMASAWFGTPAPAAVGRVFKETPYPDSAYIADLEYEADRLRNLLDAAPHPEAQALDSQLQQPDGHSTRASGVCAPTAHAVVEAIARQWDECMTEMVGIGEIDIGATIRSDGVPRSLVVASTGADTARHGSDDQAESASPSVLLIRGEK